MYELSVLNSGKTGFFEYFSGQFLPPNKVTCLTFKRLEDFLQVKVNIRLYEKIKPLKIVGEKQ